MTKTFKLNDKRTLTVHVDSNFPDGIWTEGYGESHELAGPLFKGDTFEAFIHQFGESIMSEILRWTAKWDGTNSAVDAELKMVRDARKRMLAENGDVTIDFQTRIDDYRVRGINIPLTQFACATAVILHPTLPAVFCSGTIKGNDNMTVPVTWWQEYLNSVDCSYGVDYRNKLLVDAVTGEKGDE